MNVISRLKLGFKYAFIFLTVAGVMGGIYGLLGGRIVAPMIFSMSLLGVFVFINFFIANLSLIINLILFLFKQKKASMRLGRYYLYSLTFFITFISFFMLLKLSGIKPF